MPFFIQTNKLALDSIIKKKELEGFNSIVLIKCLILWYRMLLKSIF